MTLAAVYAGVQPSEFERLPIRDSNELVRRSVDMALQDKKQAFEAQVEMFKVLIDRLDGMARLIASRG